LLRTETKELHWP